MRIVIVFIADSFCAEIETKQFSLILWNEIICRLFSHCIREKCDIFRSQFGFGHHNQAEIVSVNLLDLTPYHVHIRVISPGLGYFGESASKTRSEIELLNYWLWT